MPTPAGNEQRRGDLAQIHIAAKQLDMDPSDKDPNSTYRSMLWSIGRARSAADLDFASRKRVLEHLRKCGFKPVVKRAKPQPGWEWVNNAAEDKKPMLRKAAMILRDAGRGKEYVDALAKRLCNVERIEFCTPNQLHDVVSALVIDQKRRASRVTA